MNIKKTIDLRFPHLIPLRIRQYAFEIFDQPGIVKIEPLWQLYSAFLYYAEALLKKDPMASSFFEKTRQHPDHLAGLKALSEGRQDWKTYRSPNRYANDLVANGADWIFPFFATYYFDNNCSSLKESLLLLLKEHPLIAFLSSAPDIDPGTILHGDISVNKYVPWSEKYESPEFITDKGFSLFNEFRLADFKDRYSLRPVFVMEGLKFAEEREKEICHGEIDYLRNELKTYYDEANPNQRNNEFYAFLSTKNYGLPFKHPAGDAVVTAPVGRFLIPEFTNWGALANRDIYIFKFKEKNMEKSVNELLRVGASIVRDAGKEAAEKMHFVIMSEKRSPNIQENEILYLTVFELFAKAGLCSCKIPEGFMEVYEEYHRRSGPQHSSPYVIEPFLRRNSWMLLTGEEGSGKSYLAMILGAALATGGKLFFDWKVRRRRSKVLYVVDDEMTDDILDDRKLVLNKLYPDNDENFYIKPVHRLDLLNGGKQEIEKFLIEYGTRNDADSGAVEILILDHLLKLTANHGDEEEHWVQIRDWIENDICKRGITVILLHHEYSGTRMMGSKIIANDAPARIHLSPVDSPEDRINFSISVVKNRGGRTTRKERCISLEMKGRLRWLETNADKVDDGQIPFRKISQEDRIRLVAELRENMTQKQIAAKLMCSLSSVQKIVTKINRQ